MPIFSLWVRCSGAECCLCPVCCFTHVLLLCFGEGRSWHDAMSSGVLGKLLVQASPLPYALVHSLSMISTREGERRA